MVSSPFLLSYHYQIGGAILPVGAAAAAADPGWLASWRRLPARGGGKKDRGSAWRL
jgi:hypothetical protein